MRGLRIARPDEFEVQRQWAKADLEKAEAAAARFMASIPYGPLTRDQAWDVEAIQHVLKLIRSEFQTYHEVEEVRS
jgi:hypothetical protein